MNLETEAFARHLRERGEPYARAIVVWRRSPSSGKVGASAVITTDGKIRGWLGGACAEPAVVAEARRAIAEGTPRLMFLGPPEELEGHAREGMVSVPIACQSEGALEVYVEPVLPAPHLVAIGRSPAVDALAGMAIALGWRTTVVDDRGDPADHPQAEGVLTSLDLASVDESSFVVVATQGHYDEDALERALETPATYVGLVASRRRADSVLGYLRDRGVAEGQLARVHAPAGLDLGHVSSAEIAVAILAELVQLRAAGELTGAPPSMEPAASGVHEAIDPVCGMTVGVASARNVSVYEGRTYYFCSAGCRHSFESAPSQFISAST